MYRLVKGAGPMPSIEGGDMPVTSEEPLKRELADFVDAIDRAPADGRRRAGPTRARTRDRIARAM